MVIVVLVSIIVPWLAPVDPSKQFFSGLTDFGDPLPPNPEFRLGTDTLGRDLLSRVIYGARVSLIVGVVANGLARELVYCLCSVAVDLKISEGVDQPNWVVSAYLPKAVFR